jgi:double-stranded uracil-DNA glycosylase
MDPVLPDLLAPGLRVVFCGTAAGARSARVGAYYAGPGNRFWPTLHAIGLIPVRLEPHQFREVMRYGLGLTDLAKHTAGSDASLARADFDAAALRDKIARYAPAVLAFTSKRAALEFYRLSRVDYGPQPHPLASTQVYVLPSPSGAARRAWNIAHWHALADFVRGIAPGSLDG